MKQSLIYNFMTKNVDGIDEHRRCVFNTVCELIRENKIEEIDEYIEQDNWETLRIKALLTEPAEKAAFSAGTLNGLLLAYQCIAFLQENTEKIDIDKSLFPKKGYFDKILEILNMFGRIRHKELAEELGITSNNLTHIMQKFKQCGAIRIKIIGKNKYYSLTPAGKRYIRFKSISEG